MRYCRSCGNEIPEARVKLLPHVTFCVNCAEGRVPKKMAVTQLVGGLEHGYTTIEIVEEKVLGRVEQRDVSDVEPEVYAPEEGRPIKIKKRSEL